MVKKKFLAVGATAAAALLIAGVGVSAWVLGGKGDVKDIEDIGGISTDISTSADWGSIAVKSGKTYSLVFDQDKIFFADGVATHENKDGIDVATWDTAWDNDAWKNLTLEFVWTFDTEGTALSYIGTNATDDVEYYISFCVNENLKDYISFDTTKTGYSNENIKSSFEVHTDDEITDAAENAKLSNIYAKYKVSTGNGLAITVDGDGKYADLSFSVNEYIKWNASFDTSDPDEYDAFGGALIDAMNDGFAIKVLVEAKGIDKT